MSHSHGLRVWFGKFCLDVWQARRERQFSGNACSSALLWRLHGRWWSWWLCPSTSAWTGSSTWLTLPSLPFSVACFQSFVLRCTLACLERRELLLLPPHILHHRCARELLCCCASFYFFCCLSASNYLFLWRRKTSMISFVPQQPQAPVQVVTQVKAEALVGPKTIKALRQKFFLNNCFP